MDKTKICEALYALSGEVVVRRRASLVVPAVVLLAGAALLVMNALSMFEFSNDVSASAVFVGGFTVAVGAILVVARLFGDGVPYHQPSKSYLRYAELRFDRSERQCVLDAVAAGDVARLKALPQSQVPALVVALYCSEKGGFAAMQAYEYADLEYKPAGELKIVND